MFQALKGLLLSKGYREKSHICLKHAIETIFVDKNLISEDIFDDFDFARRAREWADYSYIYDEQLAVDLIENAEKIISEVENLLWSKPKLKIWKRISQSVFNYFPYFNSSLYSFPIYTCSDIVEDYII